MGLAQCTEGFESLGQVAPQTQLLKRFNKLELPLRRTSRPRLIGEFGIDPAINLVLDRLDRAGVLDFSHRAIGT